MRIALAIVSLFPSGGLQRDCMGIARRLMSRGHDVTILASRVQGELPTDLNIELLPVSAWSNHGRDLGFAEAAAQRKSAFDRLAGFGKLTDLDVLYCADGCDKARPSRWSDRFTARRRIKLALEAASFAPGRPTQCLLLSQNQLDNFQQAWGTEPERLALMPPTIDPGRRHPELRQDGTRERIRGEFGVGADTIVWLAVAAHPLTKGLDRAVAALAAFPEARLVVAGVADDSKQGRLMRQLADDAKVSDRVVLLGMRRDIPELMAGADLLIHPARVDTTGTVILEAVVNGLPVITTAVCGYARHVAAADAGVVLPEAFGPGNLIEALRQASAAGRRASWSENGASYGASNDLYSGLDRAAAIIAGETTVALSS
ncbi:glycosyltransferase family 4 protein [Rhodopseudomonas sp. BR0M22]|uniref:glycosyltransferase family 4 protein n=1 Tax=Rhodopseudomonas sp. BR0M22 TaxID=2269369 RepID=UPI0013DEF82A|nr:glycosyltransferase family 4 protein [Rhodopseudomonas sp. BR0M22]NEW91003.1 glycosyltransferase [Rhodopseudomonas sp. BR0M22]